MKKLVTFLILLILLAACKKETHLAKIVGHKRISINDSIKANTKIESFIKPYRDRVNNDLDSVLAYSKDTYTKNDGELNTAIGNFMADAVLEMAQPIFKMQTGKTIDMVLLNHGGIRSIISQGPVTSRTAYEVMPFENTTYITPIKGKQITEMLQFLASKKRAHPISNLSLVLDTNYNIKNAEIGGLPIDTTKTYYVATNDYLYNGGSGMTFLKSKDTVYTINYKLRNILIDYFKKIDTLKPTTDNRFIRLNNQR